MCTKTQRKQKDLIDNIVVTYLLTLLTLLRTTLLSTTLLGTTLLGLARRLQQAIGGYT